METELGKAIDLFKAHKYEDCINQLVIIENKKKLDPTIMKEIKEFKIQSMINLRKFPEAHNIIDQAINTYTELNDWENILENILFKIRILFNERKKTEALEYIDKGEEILLQVDQLTPGLLEKKGQLLFQRGQITTWMKDFELAIKYLQESVDFAEKNSLNDIKHHSLHRLGVAYGYIGEYDRGIPVVKLALHYFNEKGDLAAASTFHNIGILYAEQGKYKEARESFEKKAEIIGQTPHDIAAIGDSYWREGEIEKGIEILESGLESIRKTFKDCEENVIVLFILANLNGRKGNHSLALEQYQKIINGFGKDTEQTLVGFSNVGIASYYFHLGELETATIYGHRALEFFGKYGIKYGMGWSHFILSKIYFDKNETEEAFHHLQTCLDLRMAMGNKQDIALTLRDLITYLVEIESFDDINDYLTQLENLVSTTDSKIVRQNHLLSKALILKSKGRPKYWTQAIDILEELVAEPIADYNTILVALINLCDLLIDEFSISGDDEVLSDLKTHTSRLLDIAQRQNSYTLKVKAYHIRIITLWLLAQHSKLDINIQNARKLLQEARDLADSHGLAKLASKISNQNEKMLEKLENWDEFIRKYYEFIKSN
ncbi:MAG: tetratricopeptide repeat protein [Candidatus Heimdallarchaeota archaeon]